MTVRIIVREEAERQIRKAAKWYEERQPGLGKRLVASVRTCIEKIARFPRMSPIVHREIRRALTETFPYKVYYILPNDETAVILAVRHQSRDDRTFLTELVADSD